jgi:hypothetical protein
VWALGSCGRWLPKRRSACDEGESWLCEGLCAQIVGPTTTLHAWVRWVCVKIASRQSIPNWSICLNHQHSACMLGRAGDERGFSASVRLRVASAPSAVPLLARQDIEFPAQKLGSGRQSLRRREVSVAGRGLYL